MGYINFLDKNKECENYLTIAFRLRNSFDDKILKKEESKDFKFYLNKQEIKPIIKDNGYYVIANVADKQFCLEISSSDYLEKVVQIDVEKVQNPEKCLEICMVPLYRYKSPPSKSFIKGSADSNTYVLATKLSNRTNIRYIEFDKKESALKLSNPVNESLTGRLMAVVDSENKKFASFFVRNKISDGFYEISGEINKELIIDKNFKMSMPIQKAYITKSDGQGKYRLYVSDISKETDEEYLVCFFKNKKKVYKTINLKDQF